MVLTKGDLLPPDYLARCVVVVGEDLRRRVRVGEGRRSPDGGEGGRRSSDEASALLDAAALRELGVAQPASSGSKVRSPEIPVVSGHTGAGVQALWRGLVKCARACSVQVAGGEESQGAVRVHARARG